MGSCSYNICIKNEPEHFEFKFNQHDIIEKTHINMNNFENLKIVDEFSIKSEVDNDKNDVSKIYSDNIDYNKFINLKDKEIDNEEKNEYFPEFLNNSVKIKQLCSTHMIDLNYFSRESGTEDQLMYKTQSKYIKPKMIECLKRNLQLINQILSENINAMINDEFKQIRTFFKFEYTNDYFDFLNFKQKEYFLVLNEENNKKTDNQLYVLNSEKEFINHNISNKEYIGCQIFESGKLFAGKFNNDGKLNGKGIFINKKGNLIHGSFYF